MTVPDGGGGLDAGSDAGFDASPPIDGGGGPPDGDCVPVPPGRGAPVNVCSAAECIGLFATDVATNDLCAGEWFCEVETDCCLDFVQCRRDHVYREHVCTPFCTPGGGTTEWSGCSEYDRGGGSTGDPCNPETFTDCSADYAGCCRRELRCDEGRRVVDVNRCEGACDDRHCSGAALPDGDRCRGENQCEGGLTCVIPGALPFCTVCSAPRNECVFDWDCRTEERPADICAVRMNDRPECRCGIPERFCEPPCTDAGRSCAAGEVCNADSGHCEAIRCSAGFPCPIETACRPDDPDADAHGCLRTRCGTDLDCACGACVGGRCYDAPGACIPPV